MVVVDTHARLDPAVRAEVLALVAASTRHDGVAPLGEHKHAQVVSGEGTWTAVLARVEQALVGYAHLRWPSQATPASVVAELVAHPRWRAHDVESALLDTARRLVADGGGGWLWVWVHGVHDPVATAPARAGFALQRQLLLMAADLAAPPPAAQLPDGVDLRPYRPGDDDAELLRVNNAAFADHPENGDWTLQQLADRRALAWFDPADVLTAWRGDRLIGFHWTKRHDRDPSGVAGDGQPVGEVYILAVDPAAQGAGMGRTLLRAGLGHLHGIGCRRVVLYVDAADRAAVGLYRSEGFATVNRDGAYELWVPPAEPAAERAPPAPATS